MGEEYIEINIDSLYPGMEDYQKVLRATNSGEADARIKYEIENGNTTYNLYASRRCLF